MFRIRDLMIKVVSDDAKKFCGSCTSSTEPGCDMGTVCPCSTVSYCTMCSDCSMCTSGCTYQPTCYPSNAFAPPGRRAFLGGLSDLKAALQQQLAAVEAQEQAQDAALRPKTLAEVDLVEAKLRDALEELAAIRRDLASGEES